MKYSILSLFAFLAFFSSAQNGRLHSTYTVNNVGSGSDCTYSVTFVQVGTTNNGDPCITSTTIPIAPGDTHTWSVGNFWCNITDVYFNVTAVNGSVTHTNLFNAIYIEEGSCTSGAQDVTTWAPISSNVFELKSEVIPDVVR